MSGAICGGSPYVWKIEPEPERWCFGERKRRTWTWTLRAGWEKGTVPDESVGYWSPIWSFTCDGCGEDRRAGFGWEYEAVDM